MTDEELKPCPFCGSKIEIEPDTLYASGITWYPHEDGFRVYGAPFEYPNRCWKIVCTCGGEIDADSKEDAIKAWNTRINQE